MRKVKGYIAMGLTKNEFEFEVENDATEEEIEEIAKEEAFDFINWGWEVDEGKIMKSKAEKRQAILSLLCEKVPPVQLCEDDPERGNDLLQDFIGEHHRPEIDFVQSCDVIDAVWSMADSPMIWGREEEE